MTFWIVLKPRPNSDRAADEERKDRTACEVISSEGAPGPRSRKGNTEVEGKDSQHAKQGRTKRPTAEWKEETDERSAHDCTAVIELNP